MNNAIKKIVIVGGGTAGWLTAGIIAAKHLTNADPEISVTLIESPNIKTVGVGEGTWPTMQATLKKLGISETDFLRECDASFKQGTKFSQWVTGEKDDHYHHPFSIPQGYFDINLAPYWQLQRDKIPFCDAVSFQSHISERSLAPKQGQTPEYAYVLNYGYHLDADKFGKFLQKHCVNKLGIKHVLDDVVQVIPALNGDIESLVTKNHASIAGDLFIDCSGFSSILLGKHYGVPFIEKKDVLFIDSALAVQIPYASENSPIASFTLSTAQEAGWIWDVGLPSRRGVGHVYSSEYISHDKAEADLRRYIAPSLGEGAESLQIRKIAIVPGHREKFWHKNCVAIGLSAGFLEPLEASALVLVELSAAMLSEQLPSSREVMPIIAKRFNERFLYHWARLIDFLKLHYILSKRENEKFWLDNRKVETIPESLQELMLLWRYHFPWRYDFTQREELFPSASYQYVLYGMGFETLTEGTRGIENRQMANAHFQQNIERTRQLVDGLPTNRELINHIREYGFPKNKNNKIKEIVRN